MVCVPVRLSRSCTASRTSCGVGSVGRNTHHLVAHITRDRCSGARPERKDPCLVKRTDDRNLCEYSPKKLVVYSIRISVLRFHSGRLEWNANIMLNKILSEVEETESQN